MDKWRGLIERFLSMSTTNQLYWDKRIQEVDRHLNNAVNKTIDKTPFETLHGYTPRFHEDILYTLSKTKDDWTEPTQLQQEVR